MATLFTILLVLTWGLIYFWKRGNMKKRCVEIKDWRTSVHFVLKLQENSIFALHLCFSQDITEWCKVCTKTDSWFQKSHEEFEQLHTTSGKSKKFKFEILLSKNCILSTKKIYIQRIYVTLLSTTCVKIHQISYVIFETISHFSRHHSLREKCPNTELFLVRILLYSDQK